MSTRKAFGALAAVSLVLAACAAPVKRPLVDPSTLRFPLVETGTLGIDGIVVGQPRARDGVVYFATGSGTLTAVVVPARSILWRFKADHPVSVSPELGEDHIIFRDDGNVLYVLDLKGSLVFKKQWDEHVTSAAREKDGRLFLGTESGRVLALDPAKDGAPAWEYRAAEAILAGPIFSGDLVVFGCAKGRLLALDRAGKLVWEFAAQGTINVDPTADGGRVYFGTEDRLFYCLNAVTGRIKWSRRIQGSPLHPAFIRGRRLAVAASNSVVYFLSRRGGSIISWEAVPSRVIYGVAAAGPLALVSSAAPNLAVYDFTNGKRVGEHLASGPLAAEALWVSPFVVLVVGDEESGRQRLVFLRPQPTAASAGAGTRVPGF